MSAITGLSALSGLGTNQSAASSSVFTSLLRYSDGTGTGSHAFTSGSTDRTVVCVGSGANGTATGGGSGAIASVAIGSGVTSGNVGIDAGNGGSFSYFMVSASIVCKATSGIGQTGGLVAGCVGDSKTAGGDGGEEEGGSVPGGAWYAGVGGNSDGAYYGAGGGKTFLGAPGLVLVIEKISGLFVTTYYLMNGTGTFKFATASTLREFTCIGSGEPGGGAGALSYTAVGASEVAYTPFVDIDGSNGGTIVRDNFNTIICGADSGGQLGSGVGGAAATGVGDTKHSGGNAGTSTGLAGGGGGGTGGRTGDGANGTNAVTSTPGVGGAAGAGGSYSGAGGNGGTDVGGNATGTNKFGGGAGQGNVVDTLNGTPGEGVVIAVETHT